MITACKRVLSRVLVATRLLPHLPLHTRIVAYHRIERDSFVAQMEYLKKWYAVVSLQQAVEDLNRRQVVITFDDGYRDVWTHAYPVLKRLGLCATVFITYDLTDNNRFAWWDRVEAAGARVNWSRLKTLTPVSLESEVHRLTGLLPESGKPPMYDFLSWEEVRKMTDIIEIGSHTVTHPILTRIPLPDAVEEVVRSKAMIGEKIGKPVVSFANPNGNWNEDIGGGVRNAGYWCAVAYSRGRNARASPFRLHRRGINIRDNADVFAVKVAGVL
jgi:peptidoglycan/xylan/chitin deacetylase (PgdA/CDA1 family)